MYLKTAMYTECSARLLMCTQKFDHIIPLILVKLRNLTKSLHWLPVEKGIDLKVLLLVYHALHGQAPEFERYALGENKCCIV